MARTLPEGVIIVRHPDGREEAMHRSRAGALGLTEVQVRAAKAESARRGGGLNQVESNAFSVLKTRFPSCTIVPQFRIRISPFDAPVPVHYTADFLVAHRDARGTGWNLSLYEVKDSRRHGHSDELTRPKMALVENPFIRCVWQWTWDGKRFSERLIAGVAE